MDKPDPPVALLPYREAPRRRFVCLVCYRASTLGGPCPRCDVPLLDLSQPAVRDQVRWEAERRLEKRKLREEGPLFLLSMLLAAPLVMCMHLPFAFWLTLLLAFPLSRLVARGYARLFHGSAIATYAARRRRHSRELGLDTALAGDAALALTAGEDPALLDTEQLLLWLSQREAER